MPHQPCRTKWWVHALWPLLAQAALSLDVRPSHACAVAPPVNIPATKVEVAEEEALVVWDQARGLEHFIRRATFRGETRDFGFLVPTPSKPELEEFDERIFARLEAETRPRVETETRRSGIKPTLACLFCASYLTVFEDTSSPRPGTDEVYFSRAADQAKVERPPVKHTIDSPVLIPIDLLALIVFLGFPLVGWFIERARRRQA